jgi:hypothetical protein
MNTIFHLVDEARAKGLGTKARGAHCARSFAGRSVQFAHEIVGRQRARNPLHTDASERHPPPCAARTFARAIAVPAGESTRSSSSGTARPRGRTTPAAAVETGVGTLGTQPAGWTASGRLRVLAAAEPPLCVVTGNTQHRAWQHTAGECAGRTSAAVSTAMPRSRACPTSHRRWAHACVPPTDKGRRGRRSGRLTKPKPRAAPHAPSRRPPVLWKYQSTPCVHT